MTLGVSFGRNREARVKLRKEVFSNEGMAVGSNAMRRRVNQLFVYPRSSERYLRIRLLSSQILLSEQSHSPISSPTKSSSNTRSTSFSSASSFDKLSELAVSWIDLKELFDSGTGEQEEKRAIYVS